MGCRIYGLWSYKRVWESGTRFWMMSAYSRSVISLWEKASPALKMTPYLYLQGCVWIQWFHWINVLWRKLSIPVLWLFCPKWCSLSRRIINLCSFLAAGAAYSEGAEIIWMLGTLMKRGYVKVLICHVRELPSQQLGGGSILLQFSKGMNFCSKSLFASTRMKQIDFVLWVFTPVILFGFWFR